MNNPRRSLLKTPLALSTLAIAPLVQAPSARAQSDRPLKLILPVSAGSGVDTIARSASAALSKAFGQTLVIENQPGAGGVIGTQNLVRSAPDGNTLSIVSNNHVIYPSVLKSVPFDAINDITPIAVIGTTPLVLFVNNKLPVTDLKSFVALLKASPGKYNYGSSGNGTILHLAAEVFKEVTGTFSTHIAYRGFAPMLQDVIAGAVDWGTGALPAVQQQIKGGLCKALCIAGNQRVASAPDIPSAAEAGFPKFAVEAWFALIGPKGMSTEQVRRAHTALTTAFNTAEVKEAMAKQGNSISISTPEAASAHFRSELARYAAIVKRAGVVAQ